jgi:hypothetical protein
MSWLLPAYVTVNCVVDLRLLISRRELRQGSSIRSSPQGRGRPCRSCCNSAVDGLKAAYGCVSVLAWDDVEIPYCAYRNQSLCLVKAEVFPRC